jgi:hypothetical protein
MPGDRKGAPIPSPKAEPFKRWLAKVGYERLQEFAILTNIIHEEWSGISVKEHKEMKGLASRKRMRISRASDTHRALVLESRAESNVAIQSGRIDNGLESLRRRDFKIASNQLTTSFPMNHCPETAYFLAKAGMDLGE